MAPPAVPEPLAAGIIRLGVRVGGRGFALLERPELRVQRRPPRRPAGLWRAHREAEGVESFLFVAPGYSSGLSHP